MPAWEEAATIFERSGQKLAALTDTVVDYLLGRGETLETASALLTEIADLEESAFRVIAAA